jgi:hypothetical protein
MIGSARHILNREGKKKKLNSISKRIALGFGSQCLKNSQDFK